MHSFKKKILFLILVIKCNNSISYNNVYAKKICIIPVPNVLLLNHCGRPLSNAGVSGRKKAKVCFSDCNMQKDLSKWNKQELQAYLIHYNLKKSGNKPDLLLRIRQRMDTD